MNDWALVTGASSGIGAELAKLLAADGYPLVLVSRNQTRLEQLDRELRTRWRIQTRIVAKDLSLPDAPRDVFDATAGKAVSLLVNNAGFGAYGAFAESNLRVQNDMLQVNMGALVQLTHWFLRPMLDRGHGRILNVASTAAFLPGPNVNVYYATKAFVYSFSYALAEELKGTGVTVTTLCPGTTRTRFFERAGIRMARSWPMMEAGRVAELGYRGLMRGQRVVIPGAANRLAAFLAKRAPARWTARVVAKLHRPK